jgi:hypothetical protein
MNMRIDRSNILLSAVLAIVGGALIFGALMPKFALEQARRWPTYRDRGYGYQIDHPPVTYVIPFSQDASSNIDEGLEQIGGVSFAAATDGPGTMGVKVHKDPRVSTLEEWLAFENRKGERVRKEKTITIDGHVALVTYYVSVSPGFEETFPLEKKTAFLKDGLLFEIWTRFYDDPENHARVWRSFRFRE